MKPTEILRTIYDPKSRSNPYPLFAELRKRGVSFQEGVPTEHGTYVVARYRDIDALFHDPRISSDSRKGEKATPPLSGEPRAFIGLDPPQHDRLRAQAMRQFGPPHRPDYVESLRPVILKMTTSLIDGLEGRREVDVVGKVGQPLPVKVISEVLGVSEDDQPKFKKWADDVIGSNLPETKARREDARTALDNYMRGLVEFRKKNPGNDFLSKMMTDAGVEGAMPEDDLVTTGTLLLIAGHETTMNLVGNGILTLMRHPQMLERLRHEPELIVSTVEELLRYEPPVQFLSNRTPLEDIAIGGTVIPKGVSITLAIAAGNRDPERFPEPDRFDPERTNNAHLGFGSGLHYCFGAPLARVEAQIVLLELARRLVRPRLIQDPPTYRESPFARGPSELFLEIGGVRSFEDTTQIMTEKERAAG